MTDQRYTVSELQAGDEARWDEFVESSPQGTFFHLAGWRRVIEESLRHPSTYLLCELDGEIVGVLPLAQVRSRLFGNSLISLPFLVYGGVVSVDPAATDMLIDAACRKAESLGVDHLELRNQSPSGRGWPVKDIYATFSKRLSPDPEENMREIPRKQRAMIRKGIKAGLTAEMDSDADRLYQALLACKRNLGTPFFGRGYLQYLIDTFGDRAEVLTVVKGQEVVCSVMSFRFRNEILPYYGGGGDIARGLKGNDYMYWAVMEKACQEGVEVFDYGRSMVGTGAYRFKKHWGFEPTTLAYEFFLVESEDMPNLNPSNPKYRLLIDLWKRLPLGVAGTLGPPIARLLG